MRSVRLLVLIMTLMVAAVPALAHEGDMMCPGHDGNTVDSLVMCVNHAAEMGHITNQGVANSLLAKLSAAQAAVGRGQNSVAVNNLNAFINEVGAQSGKKIDAMHAGHMLEHAGRVIAALGG